MTHRPRRFLRLPWRSAARIQADIDEEIRFELDMRSAELRGQGLDADAASRQAVKEFGDIEATRRYCAEVDREGEAAQRRTDVLAELRQDLLLAWRGMRRTPGFAIVVLLTLALGIGANTAVFSVVRKVLLERLPYHEPRQLVRLYGGSADNPDARGMLTPGDIADMEQSRAFDAVAPFGYQSGFTFVGDLSAEIWGGMRVGGGFFRLLGAPAMLGRTIEMRDTEPGAAPVLMLSHDLWQRAFGGDSGVVGRDVQLDGSTQTIVGVMGPRFVSPTFTAELWAPLAGLEDVQRNPLAARRTRVLRAVGRVTEGVTPEQLRGELAAIAHRVRDQQPEPDEAAPVNAVPLREAMVGEMRPVLLVVMGAAGLVLVIACVNVAGLFLSRAASRRRELAVRTALGAGRGRLVRQLLTESAMIGVAGGAAGIALAYWGKGVLVRVAEHALPSVGDVRIDAGVLAFGVFVSLASALAFGLVPALIGTRFDLTGSLSEASRGAAGGRTHARVGRTLVAAQMALAVVLLVGAGLLGRTLISLEQRGVGYDTTPAQLTFRVNLSSERYADPTARGVLWDGFIERITALPSVESVGLVGISPWNGMNMQSLSVEDGYDPAAEPDGAYYAIVSEDYFDALGIAVRTGRQFTSQDRDGTLPVALVSESLAHERWPGGSPIGRRVRIAGEGRWREVVGVVADVRAEPTGEGQPTAYVPSRQNMPRGAEFIVRTTGDAMALVPPIRAALREFDPALPMVNTRTMDDVLRADLAGQRLPMLFTTAFAALALVLAALGVYSVMAYAVTARVREFGIRTALGAQRASVLALVLRQGLTTSVIGIVIGVAVAVATVRVLEAMLFGVTPHDATTFIAAPLILLAVTILACLLPARRATRVEPVEALRAD